MTIKELVMKWDLPHTWCAKKIGISKSSFGNKVKERNKYCYFKKEEIDKLILSLKELSNDIKTLKNNDKGN